MTDKSRDKSKHCKQMQYEGPGRTGGQNGEIQRYLEFDYQQFLSVNSVVPNMTQSFKTLTK